MFQNLKVQKKLCLVWETEVTHNYFGNYIVNKHN